MGGFLGESSRRRLGLGRRVWMPHVTDYYRFALGASALSGLLCAPPSPRALGEIIDAIGREPLDPDEQEHLTTLAVRAATRGVESLL